MQQRQEEIKKEMQQKQEEIKARAKEVASRIPIPCGFEDKLGLLKRYSKMDYIS